MFWLSSFISNKNKADVKSEKINNDKFIFEFLKKNGNIPLIIFSKKGYFFEKLQITFWK